jgi:hypothetical protein
MKKYFVILRDKLDILKEKIVRLKRKTIKCIVKQDSANESLINGLIVQLNTVKIFLTEPGLNASVRVTRMKKYLGLQPIVRNPKNNNKQENS